jgi:6-phosphogluconolactonase (cycloisomerase 2 family)
VATAAQPLGTVTQLGGTAGCFTFDGKSEDGAGTCSTARGLAEGESAIVSPDGANVYVGSYPNTSSSPKLKASLTVFSRNRSTSGLTQLPGTAGCLTPDGSSKDGANTCTKARGLISAAGDGHDFAFTSDGRWAYVVAQNHDPTGVGAVLIFQRDPATGGLTQLPGTAGCISTDGSDQDGAGQCQTDSTLNGPDGISISSDDRFVYVVDYNNDTIHVFARNASTGALSEIQCLGEASTLPGGCTKGRVLGDSEFLALSPDGTHAYGGDFVNGLSVFDRDPSTGLLTQKTGAAGCITNDGKDDTGATTCTVGRVTKGNYPILIAPNGATLYNGDETDHGFSVFHINADGTLSQLIGANGCVTIDGKDNTGASTCATGRGITDPYGGAISPDGATLYVSSRESLVGGLASFSINANTGVATQLSGLGGCVTADGSSNGTAGQCTDGRALSEGYGMSVSPDGSSVYQSTDGSSNAGLAVFARESAPVCQATTVTTASRTPVTVPLQCSDPDGDPVTRSIVTGPAHGTLSAINNSTGTVTYTPAAEFSGTDSFTFAASDGVSQGAPATATIKVAPGPLPACQSVSVSTGFGKAVTVPMRCSDADGDAVTRSIASAPKHGTLSAINNSAGTVTYTPAAAFTGTDSFTFTASDGVNRSGAATATIAVAPRPALFGLSVFPHRFSLAGRMVNGHCVKPTPKNERKTHCRRAIRLHVGFKLNVADAVTFTLKRQVPGRRVRGSCVKPTHKNRKHLKCLRFVRLPGKITLTVAAGFHRFTFKGRIGGRLLGPGTYQLTATPTGGIPRKTIFQIVR